LDTAGVNGLDVLLAVLLVAAVASGYRRGAVLQVAAYGGLLLGLAVGAMLAPRLAAPLPNPATEAFVALGTLLACAAIGEAAGWLLGSRIRARARRSRFGPLDAAGGAGVTLLAVLLAIWFIALNLANGPFPQVAAEVRGSAIVRGLDSALPEPPSVVGEVRRFFNRFGFPEVFSGIPPAPAAPVQAPSAAEARRAATLAAGSTVKIVGRACDEIQEGSGFIVADRYVVTNAHVLAGVGDPQVSNADGASTRAVTVAFDPELDLAVLLLAERLGPPLPLARTDVPRGTGGAVLGYPQGGPLDAEAAAVRQPIEAIGHDIYGRSNVERAVYELQTVVRPGNSGGPFVLPDGRVAGVVFAASSVDPGIGYALRSTEILDEVAAATGRTAPVGTGPCIR
jgi:S1-C subfamily serine protease